MTSDGPPPHRRGHRLLARPGITGSHAHLSFFAFRQMTNIDMLAPRKALLVAGADAHSRYYSEDVRAMAPDTVDLVIVPGADHVDLYDRKDLIPFDRLDEFFTENLARP